MVAEDELENQDDREEFTRWAGARQQHLTRADVLLTGEQ